MPKRFAIPLRSLLDSRPRAQADRAPIRDAVNLPGEELRSRIYELPVPNRIIRVAATGADAHAAVETLLQMGRFAELAPFELGAEPEWGRLWSPNRFLEEVAPDLSPGRALDLGCGVGRDAVFLASLDWNVRAVDRLPDALQRAESLALNYPGLQARIEWEICDLSKSVPKVAWNDLVTMFFFLDRAALSWAIERLRPGGTVVLETFSEVHRAKFGKPHSAEAVLSAGEAEEMAEGLRILHISEDWRPDGRHTARLLARRES